MSDFLRQPARLTRGGAWLVICFLVLPIAVVVPISLTDRSYLSLPQHALSLQYYANLFTSAAWLSSIVQSLFIALCATLLAVAAGAACAIGCWRLGSRTADLVRAFMLVPLIVPTIVYALGLYRLWAQLGLLDTYTGVVIAHAVTGMPYVIILVSTGLAGFDLRLEQASRNLGAGPAQTLRLVVLPGIMPALLSSAIFAFIHSWDDLVLVLFIAGRAVFTLPRRIWDGINDQLDPTMAAVATVLLVLTIFFLWLEAAVRRRR
jgi:putative spermidine/putrescine transport system permease protein